uniref:NADH dehydrogenase subunit 4L n=1 Tax=Halticus minutus TaxID=2917254 RepID=UPI001F12B3D9|nr:NADH dehydrogenase subunit 4L [Halticus minutus]UKT60750.1 NADH dehydrogenase subunit 4L [Halticus minutus]
MLFYFLNNYYPYLMFFSGLVVFSFSRNYYLLTLLSLEYLVLCIFTIMVKYYSLSYGDLYLIMIFLIFSVCEGVLGLSILVCYIRNHGNDYLNPNFIMKW